MLGENSVPHGHDPTVHVPHRAGHPPRPVREQEVHDRDADGQPTGPPDARRFGPGEVLLVEDVDGHATRQLSAGPRRSVFVTLLSEALRAPPGATRASSAPLSHRANSTATPVRRQQARARRGPTVVRTCRTAVHPARHPAPARPDRRIAGEHVRRGHCTLREPARRCARERFGQPREPLENALRDDRTDRDLLVTEGTPPRAKRRRP